MPSLFSSDIINAWEKKASHCLFERETSFFCGKNAIDYQPYTLSSHPYEVQTLLLVGKVTNSNTRGTLFRTYMSTRPFRHSVSHMPTSYRNSGCRKIIVGAH